MCCVLFHGLFEIRLWRSKNHQARCRYKNCSVTCKINSIVGASWWYHVRILGQTWTPISEYFLRSGFPTASSVKCEHLRRFPEYLGHRLCNYIVSFFFRKFPGIYFKFLNHYQWNCTTFPLKPLREMTRKFNGSSLWEFWSLVYKYMPGLALYHGEILHTYANIVRVISVPCIEQPYSERYSSYRSIRELRVIARLRGISLKVLSKFLGGLFSTLFFVFGVVKGNYGQHSGIWPTCTVP